MVIVGDVVGKVTSGRPVVRNNWNDLPHDPCGDFEQYGVPTTILDQISNGFSNPLVLFHRSGVQPFAKLLYAMLIPASRLGHSLPLPWGEPTIF